MKKILFFLLLAISFSACQTVKTSVGDYKNEPGYKTFYSEGKQMWLLHGILPLGRTNINTPKNGQCEVVSYYSVGDIIVNSITLGFVKSRTIKVYIKTDKKGLLDF